MIAPLPDLIVARYSTGLFYQLFAKHKTEFSQYFGFIFEDYCGRVLAESVGGIGLWSEHQIRSKYPESSGRAPDWVLKQGKTTVLIECKATRFTRLALVLADEELVNDSLKQVVKALVQLHEFREACRRGSPELRELDAEQYIPVVVTLETMYGINSGFFREHIDDLLERKGITALPWRVLSVEELEVVQPHVKAGVPLAEALTKISSQPAKTLKEFEKRTGRTNEDSFLAVKHDEIMAMFGIPDRRGSRKRQGRKR